MKKTTIDTPAWYSDSKDPVLRLMKMCAGIKELTPLDRLAAVVAYRMLQKRPGKLGPTLLGTLIGCDTSSAKRVIRRLTDAKILVSVHVRNGLPTIRKLGDRVQTCTGYSTAPGADVRRNRVQTCNRSGKQKPHPSRLTRTDAENENDDVAPMFDLAALGSNEHV